jgi:S-DNA-T family DNA segregation ATPase FtsK/SpoIIIE
VSPEQFKTIAAVTLKLASLGHEVTFVEPITVGPLITTYRFAPKNSLRVAQITALAADIAMALAVEDVTIRRLPGEAVVGISIPNAVRTIPLWRDHIGTEPGVDRMKVPLALGVDSQGKTFREDLTELPHLLIAGSTGGGKTVLLRSLIAALAYWKKPDEVQLVLSDTKQVEFGVFDADPHLWRPRTTMTLQTVEYMDALNAETERRLKLLAAAKQQNVGQYNELFSHKRLPYIVLVIDELADFVGKAADKGIAKLAEGRLQLIAQRSRAAGIHVIAATQRPSVDVIAGTIKSNFTARLSFRLPSEVDSRTVLGHGGAEHLLSKGDCYYVSPNHPASRRLHSCYASNDDITQCIAFAQQQQQTFTATQSQSTRKDTTIQ